MQKKPVISTEAAEDANFFLKWGKFVTRVTAIGATITGAVSAFFSTTSIASGVALTAAGASTLAAAEKLPDQRWVKTKHIPPQRKSKMQKAVLAPDILAKPEKIVPVRKPRTEQHVIRAAASYERIKTDTKG